MLEISPASLATRHIEGSDKTGERVKKALMNPESSTPNLAGSDKTGERVKKALEGQDPSAARSYSFELPFGDPTAQKILKAKVSLSADNSPFNVSQMTVSTDSRSTSVEPGSHL